MSKMFSTQQYYDFILFVESTFLENLNLQMMMTYTDGDLVHEIKTRILASDIAIEKFSMLCNVNVTLSQEKKSTSNDLYFGEVHQYASDLFCETSKRYWEKKY